jgi:hypothetical protein
MNFFETRINSNHGLSSPSNAYELLEVCFEKVIDMEGKKLSESANNIVM